MRWLRLLRAVLIGLVTGRVIGAIAAYGYAALAMTNVRQSPAVPWAPALALPLLWLYWRYLGGWGWPKATSGYRHRMRRSLPIPRERLALVAATGVTGYAFVLAAVEWAFRLSNLPPHALRMLPDGVPWWSALSFVLVLALVAGVTEEVAYRGYLQKPVEEAGYPALAIVLSAAVFTFVHAGKSWFLIQALPMLVAAIWYGYFTYATGSIRPMIFVHTFLNIALFVRYDILKMSPPESFSSQGATPSFWLNGIAVLALGAMTFILTKRLSRLARRPASQPRSPPPAT